MVHDTQTSQRDQRTSQVSVECLEHSLQREEHSLQREEHAEISEAKSCLGSLRNSKEASVVKMEETRGIVIRDEPIERAGAKGALSAMKKEAGFIQSEMASQ